MVRTLLYNLNSGATVQVAPDNLEDVIDINVYMRADAGHILQNKFTGKKVPMLITSIHAAGLWEEINLDESN